MRFSVWCFVIPPVMAGLSLIARAAMPADQ
jgi:hypothetical protein